MKPCRVLVVDDEQIVRLAVKAMVERAGAPFVLAGAAADGEAALAAYRAEGADVVVTDLKMPRMDGLELVRALRAEADPPEILVLSNYDDFAYVREALRLGVHDYMLKTAVEFDSFRAALDEAWAKAETRALPSGSGTEASRADPGTDGPDGAVPMPVGAAAASGEVFAGVEELLPQGDEGRAVLLFCLADAAGKKDGAALASLGASLAEEALKAAPRRPAAFPGPATALVAAFADAASAPRAEAAARRMADGAALYYQAELRIAWAGPLLVAAELPEAARRCAEAAASPFWRANRVLAAALPEAAGRSLDAALAPAEEALFSAGTTEAAAAEALPRAAEAALAACAASGCAPAEAKRRLRRLYRLLELRLAAGPERAPRLAELFMEADEAVAEASSDAEVLEAVSKLAAGIGERDKIAAPLRAEVSAVMDWVDAHIGERVSVFELSQRLRISETYLCTVFKAQVGSSIVTWANDRKLEKAKVLLESGAYLVKEAAAAVGIEDPFYFNRLFRRRYGTAPSEAVPPRPRS